ncbi:Flp family type IVb pilin [bacterium]|nr:Flp family type IVb pilin [bacterium]
MTNYLTEQYVKFTSRLASLLKKEDGQTLVEYALLLVLIAIVVIAAVTILGQKACNVYSSIGSSLSN